MEYNPSLDLNSCLFFLFLMTMMSLKAFVAPGKIICTGSDDATMRIWNPRSGENIHVVRGMLETCSYDSF